MINVYKISVYTFKVSLCIIMFISFLTCSDDIPDNNRKIEHSVVLSIRVPKTSTPKTKALTVTDEDEVKTIEILLFDSNGNFIYEPIYCNTINSNTQNSQIKNFTILVPPGTYNIVVLANSRSLISNIRQNINQGDSKVSVFNQLIISNEGKWNASPSSSGYMPIPMWGEIPSLTVDTNLSENNPVSLLRIVAKINVELSTTVVRNKFILKSVYLYNYNDKGYLIPDANNWNNSQKIVTNPSIPVSAKKKNIPLIYDGTAILSGVSCVGEIYTFEALSGNSSLSNSNTCLVVGGVFMQDATPSYYRIDFVNESGFMPLLRNHYYNVNVSDIDRSGYASPEEAFNAQSINIKSGIVIWDDSKITEFVYDGQNILGVSKGNFEFGKEQSILNDENILWITTDFPEGWKIEKVIDESGLDINSQTGWLSTDFLSGTMGATIPVQLLLGMNNTGATRIGFVYVTAGRLKQVVTVIQNG